MNKPDDFECWRLPDDDSVQKVTCKKDFKVPNAMMIVIEREDHTLGNLLRMQLLEDDQVLFSGYRVPHPLEPAIQVKIQTRSQNPGPVQAVQNALDKLEDELKIMKDSFAQALRDFTPAQQ
uniref:DNA-directed RNA polymerase RBP11-like dimerisation domain-containing protein n=1 Tax=Chrysotila carterae TaxID=13221 RepID=A0A7S4C1P2_CHRCT|mmetsp:Transcript_28308/g.59507  ORF Transcript_28308/g.59507 Transcript_28308/m.59507 type:complete len:121 (-) Transcript_28308:296-658(-)